MLPDQSFPRVRGSGKTTHPQVTSGGLPADPETEVPRLLHGLPQLTTKTARLLVLGDVDRRYSRGNDDNDGWNILSAIVTGAANYRWSEEQLWTALVYRNTAGGKHLRMIRERNETKARQVLQRAMRNAAAVVQLRPAYGGRADAAADLEAIRDLVATFPWTGKAGATDQRVLLAHLAEAGRAGGREHSLSERQVAERAGVALSTAQAAHRRVVDGGWLVRVNVPTASDDEQTATVWCWRAPTEIRAKHDTAQLLLVNGTGHPPPPQPWRVGGVPDTRIIEQLMAHDAFHGHALGGVGLRLLAVLQVGEGVDLGAAADAVGIHPATVRRRIAQLRQHGLARDVDGLWYVHPDVAAVLGLFVGVDQASEEETGERLSRVALYFGTFGAGARRVWRHGEQRRQRAEALARLRARALPRGEELADAEHVDSSGVGVGPWSGWDCSDPWRPVWRGDLGAVLPAVA